MKETFHNRIFRKNYGKIKEVLEIPNLIEIQLDSYEKFLQKDIAPDKRDAIGLQAVFNSVFPIRIHMRRPTLDLREVDMGIPRTPRGVHVRGLTYAPP
jgi:DNA-directed RNA polymerase subunit beta